MAASVLAVVPAEAQTFDIKQIDVEKGAFDVGVNSTYQRGFPKATSGEFNRSAYELSANYALTDWWRLSGILKIENPAGGGSRLTNAGLESIFVIKPVSDKKDRDTGYGWFTALEVATDAGATNAVTFGPIFSAKAGKLMLTGNPFLQQTFGQNSDDGIAFSYGWQAKVEINTKLSVALEGYGAIKDLGSSPPLSEQEHRIGPVLYTELDLGRGVTITPDFGVFFGLTNGTPDVAVKVNVGIPLIKPAKSSD